MARLALRGHGSYSVHDAPVLKAEYRKARRRSATWRAKKFSVDPRDCDFLSAVDPRSEAIQEAMQVAKQTSLMFAIDPQTGVRNQFALTMSLAVGRVRRRTC
jgi:hypothetical protein